MLKEQESRIMKAIKNRDSTITIETPRQDGMVDIIKVETKKTMLCHAEPHTQVFINGKEYAKMESYKNGMTFIIGEKCDGITLPSSTICGVRVVSEYSVREAKS